MHRQQMHMGAPFVALRTGMVCKHIECITMGREAATQRVRLRYVASCQQIDA